MEFQSITPMIDFPYIDIQWTLKSDNIENIYFYIYRSYGSSTDFTLLTALPLVNALSFRDLTIDAKDHYMPIIYKIKAIDARAGLDPKYAGTEYEWVETLTDVYSRLNKYDYLMYKEVLRKNRLILDGRYAGVPVYIYKKKTYGPYCTVCGNTTLKLAQQSRCISCYGTGRVGGYAMPPIGTFANFIEVTSKTRKKQRQGPSVPMGFKIDICPPPIVDVGDLVYRHDCQEFYGVKSINMLRFKESLPIRQDISAFLLIRDDIAYDLPLVLS